MLFWSSIILLVSVCVAYLTLAKNARPVDPTDVEICQEWLPYLWVYFPEVELTEHYKIMVEPRLYYRMMKNSTSVFLPVLRWAWRKFPGDRDWLLGQYLENFFKTETLPEDTPVEEARLAVACHFLKCVKAN